MDYFATSESETGISASTFFKLWSTNTELRHTHSSCVMKDPFFIISEVYTAKQWTFSCLFLEEMDLRKQVLIIIKSRTNLFLFKTRQSKFFWQLFFTTSKIQKLRNTLQLWEETVWNTFQSEHTMYTFQRGFERWFWLKSFLKLHKVKNTSPARKVTLYWGIHPLHFTLYMAHLITKGAVF